MSKKLKIKFWKAEKALAMQVVEQEGLPKEKNDGAVRINCSAFITDNYVSLRSESRYDYDITMKTFDRNSDRDEYLDAITQAITDELFTGTGELKVGEMCEVKICNGYDWTVRRLLAILPKTQTYRYIAEHSNSKSYFTSCAEARPLAKRTEPKVEENGEVITYTWEEE